MPEVGRRRRGRRCGLAPSTPVRRAALRLEQEVGCELSVVSGGRTTGRISAELLARAMGHGLGGMRIGDLWSPKPSVGAAGPSNATQALRCSLEPERLALLREVGRVASSRGDEAYLVGGAVRDALLGVRGGNFDLDVVVVGDAIALARAVARSRRGVVRTHPSFGTATVTLGEDLEIDLAESRRERYAAPAALPSVAPADLHRDLLRRDFSINAIACSLMPGRFGRIVDPCTGRRDLARRRVRLLHGLSLIEDPTRAFRALRLCHRLGLTVEKRTAELIAVARRRRVFDALSGSRLSREVRLLFAQPGWVEMARRLQRYELWTGTGIAPAPLPRRYEELRRLERWLSRLGGDDAVECASRWPLAIALLNADRPVSAREELAERLRPDRSARRTIVEGPAGARRILSSLRRSTRLRPSRVLALCNATMEANVLLAGAMAPGAVERRALWRYLTDWRHVRADIGGRDLIDAGIGGGRAIGRGLAAALAAKLDDARSSRTRQLAVALRAARA